MSAPSEGSHLDQMCLSTTVSLGDWVRRQLARSNPDTGHIIRVITREMDRWGKNNITIADAQTLAAEPCAVGDPHWDALVSGLVARFFHLRRHPAPAWTNTPPLDEAWDPYEGLVRNNSRHAINVMFTPVELLHRGVILNVRELELL